MLLNPKNLLSCPRQKHQDGFFHRLSMQQNRWHYLSEMGVWYLQATENIIKFIGDNFK